MNLEKETSEPDYEKNRTMSGFTLRLYVNRWAEENPLMTMLSQPARDALCRDLVKSICEQVDNNASNDMESFFR